MNINDQNHTNTVSSTEADIINEIEQANQLFLESLEHYRNAGEKLAKIRAEKANRSNGFRNWLKENLKMELTTAIRYCSIFQKWDDLMEIKDKQKKIDMFSFVDFLKLIKYINSKFL